MAEGTPCMPRLDLVGKEEENEEGAGAVPAPVPRMGCVSKEKEEKD